MRLQARVIGPQEEALYDHFVAHSPKGHILQSYAWGEVKAFTGWRPIRLLVYEGDRPVAAVSLLKRSLPGLRKSIFYSPRGPVLDFEREDVWRYLLSEVAALAGQEGVILWKIDPDIPVENEKVKELLLASGFRLAVAGSGFEGVQPRHVFRLDITPPAEEILASFHPKTRYNLRLAQKRGVTIKSDCAPEDLRVFYDLLTETARRDRFLIRSYSYFETIWRELVARDYAKLFLAYYQGEPIAGTLAFIFGDKAWYLYGASSNRHRNVMPNYLLQWTMILWAKERGCRIYDFRGVPGKEVGEDHPLYGLYRFKKGFNGIFTEFIGEYDYVYSPFYYWLWQAAQPVYSRGISRLLWWRKKAEARGEVGE